MFQANQQIGGYTLIKQIGKGGFGEVWLAEKRSQFVTKKVAIKLPLDDQVNFEAIRQEASLWEQASGHANILPIIDADIYDGQVVIVSEYAEGGSLFDKLQTEGKFLPQQAVEMTIGILNGLDYLHSQKIIHRDIKPQNILLQRDTPRLADFGISRAMEGTTNSVTISGTDAYMAPEAFDGKRNVKTDIWSVGVVLYQLLTRSLPFPQSHPTERMFAVLHKEFEPLPDDIPQDLRNIVQKSLAKNALERYQSAKEMREDLQNVLLKINHPTFAPTEVLKKKDLFITNKDVEPGNETIDDKTSLTGRRRIISDKNEILVTEISPPDNVIPTIAVPFADKTNKRQINPLYYIGAGVLALFVFAGIIGITALIITNKPVANEIKVEFKALSTTIPIEVTVDGKASTKTIIPDSQQTFIGQQSVKLSYFRGYTPDKIQLTVNGKQITAPNPINGKTPLIEFEINKNNITQILQSGQITVTNATTPSPTLNSPDTFKNSIGMEFIKIPAGSFMMGSDTGYPGEKPVHKVTISNDFYLSKYEVTQAQWKAIMGNNPSKFQGDNLPVENVSWNDAQEFIKKLNANGEVYRLPTEAEWEYAARAGTTGDFAGDLDSIAWYDKNSGNRTHEVGTKQQNAWGLYDMEGNVWEWCQDWDGAYSSESVTNPTGASTGSERVNRGGGWNEEAGGRFSALHVSARNSGLPSARESILGFRLLRTK